VVIIKVWFAKTLDGLGESAALNAGKRAKRPARHTHSVKGFEARRGTSGLQVRCVNGMGEHPGTGAVKRSRILDEFLNSESLA
jgi:hypothetical protein